jgi:hypothetical protein
MHRIVDCISLIRPLKDAGHVPRKEFVRTSGRMTGHDGENPSRNVRNPPEAVFREQSDHYRNDALEHQGAG